MRAALLALPLLFVAALAVADEIELRDGTTYKGELLEETGDVFRFRVEMNGGEAEIKFKHSKVKALTVDGERRVLKKAKKKKSKRKKKKKSKDETRERSKAKNERPVRSDDEVEALIQAAGDDPSWLESTPLNVPPELNTDWTTVKGWNNKKNMGAFFWDRINPNPKRWQEGARLFHHTLELNEGDAARHAKSMSALGGLYHNLLEDWARAAYWWREAKKRGTQQNHDIALAHAYWKLGSAEMAKKVLKRYGGDGTRHGNIIKLWADMGDLDKALELAKQKARRSPDVAWLAAGNACRYYGRYDEAVTYFEKALAANKGSRDITRNKTRAQANLDAVKVMQQLDLEKVRGGKYQDTAPGYNGPITVEVLYAKGKLRELKPVKYKEKQFYSSLTDIPSQILKKQALDLDVDATTNATITAEAIQNAAAKALFQGQKKKKKKKRRGRR